MLQSYLIRLPEILRTMGKVLDPVNEAEWVLLEEAVQHLGESIWFILIQFVRYLLFGVEIDSPPSISFGVTQC